MTAHITLRHVAHLGLYVAGLDIPNGQALVSRLSRQEAIEACRAYVARTRPEVSIVEPVLDIHSYR